MTPKQTVATVMESVPAVNADKYEVYGIRLQTAGLDLEQVRGVVDSLVVIAESARPWEDRVERKRGQYAEQVLDAARRCASSEMFDEVYESILKVRWSALHGKKPLPKAVVQSASDIRRMYRQRVDLMARDPATKELLTFSALKTAAAKSRAVAAAKLKESAERAEMAKIPAYVVSFQAAVNVMMSLCVVNEGTYRDSCPPMEQATALIRDLTADYIRQNPDALRKPEPAERDEDEEMAEQGEDEEHAVYVSADEQTAHHA